MQPTNHRGVLVPTGNKYNRVETLPLSRPCVSKGTVDVKPGLKANKKCKKKSLSKSQLILRYSFKAANDEM